MTPPALATQWADEIAAHAPDLKVFIYDGWAKLKVPITEADVEAEEAKRRSTAAQKSKQRGEANAERSGQYKVNPLQGDDIIMGETASGAAHDPDGDSDSILDWPSYINQFDVCITTYNILRSDIFIARAPPERPRRRDVEYKILRRPRSPLVMCEWYRVIMDEVQMMRTGMSEFVFFPLHIFSLRFVRRDKHCTYVFDFREMVSLIPRLSSFAVSGTPARAQVSDLISTLKFLHVSDLVSPSRMWDRLLKHRFKNLFTSLFQKYSVRLVACHQKIRLVIDQTYDIGR